MNAGEQERCEHESLLGKSPCGFVTTAKQNPQIKVVTARFEQSAKLGFLLLRDTDAHTVINAEWRFQHELSRNQISVEKEIKCDPIRVNVFEST